MNRRSRKLLLVMLMLALAVNPLRGALARPAQADTQSDVHCAGMQHDMPETPAEAAGDQGCMQDCDGSCCDSICGICAHGVAALPGSDTTAGGIPVALPAATVTCTFPVRTHSPPLRPPASLPG